MSNRSVFARRCSRDTATLVEWMTCTSIPRACSHRASQKPSRPASKASAIRSIILPALTASSRQRTSSRSSTSGSGPSFFRGWRSTPGAIPATSQLASLISATTIRVPSWSKATRERLGSSTWGTGNLHHFHPATMMPDPAARPIASSSNGCSNDNQFLARRFIEPDAARASSTPSFHCGAK